MCLLYQALRYRTEQSRALALKVQNKGKVGGAVLQALAGEENIRTEDGACWQEFVSTGPLPGWSWECRPRCSGGKAWELRGQGSWMDCVGRCVGCQE